MSWVPLEANPQVMNDFCHRLGLPHSWGFTDVYGLDDDMLDLLPAPVKAMIMLFPISDIYEQRRLKEDEETTREGAQVPSHLYFTRQTIGNACGTIGLLHSVLNSNIELKPGPLSELRSKSQGKTPSECAKILETDPGIIEAHAASAQEGQTVAPDADENVNLHFVAFVKSKGHLYELDGRRPMPIDRGPVGNFAKAAAHVIKSYMADDPNALDFCVLALTPALV